MKASDFMVIGEVESVRRPSGAIIINGMHLADTLKCVHCGVTWIPVKGSGITRGWCMNCDGVTCGRPQCIKCVPFEKKMEMYEKGFFKALE